MDVFCLYYQVSYQSSLLLITSEFEGVWDNKCKAIHTSNLNCCLQTLQKQKSESKVALFFL